MMYEQGRVEEPDARARTMKNTLWLREQVTIEREVEQVYAFLTTEIPGHYQAMDPGHERFEVLGGGPLVEGAVIDCRERAGNQEVHHRYVVQSLVENALVYYVSRGSRSFVHLDGRTLEGSSNTYVSYELRPLPGGRTQLRMLIAIELESWWKISVARTLGRIHVLWKTHQREELRELAALIEGYGRERSSPREAGALSPAAAGP